ncbi:MAG: LysR family transcriptional regulator [Proteobacteria bacterium]|nr:LysR family transcriptional regulator [Pseudomonadota bacterium]
MPQLAAFLAVVEAGSFTAAGRRAGVDKAVISRRVKALEAALEVRLLHRTTRSMRVTDVGKELVRATQEPLGELSKALMLAANPGRIQGTVRVATFPGSSSIWSPVLRELAETHPEVRLELAASEVMARLVDEGFDLALRMGRMPDSSMVSRRLATWRYILCANPEWVAAHPEVQEPADLAPHWVLYGSGRYANRWRFEKPGSIIEIEVGSVLTASTGELIQDGVIAGLGVSALTPVAAEAELERGRLVRILPEWRVDHSFGIFAVTPHRAYLPARVEVVLEALRRQLTLLEGRWTALSE